MPIRKITVKKSPTLYEQRIKSQMKKRVDYRYNINESEIIKTQTENQMINCDNAEHIMNNAKFRKVDKFLFKILDYINPFMNKHPKIGNKIFFVFEKIIKFNNKNLFNVIN